MTYFQILSWMPQKKFVAIGILEFDFELFIDGRYVLLIPESPKMENILLL